ncbi:2-C-methyl-D-erythritol 4-phosphate cytidylyltransferase [Candidatus Marinamargulisbacteria bacterium SCGC AG-439-L15]|nr:2-C-methyl-D-erythritol 4-phosphate cytidylyltransferase [Candidatus Marinamargulisbacteria bacterium SCGC AG-439-L15]
MTKKALIITAAGSGTRFGDSRSKCLALLQEKPVITHSLDTLLSYKWEKIIVTAPDNALSDFENITQTYPVPISVIPGGKTRKESVQKAVQKLSDCTTVFIHDAARPLLTNELIQRLLDAPEEWEAVIPGIPVTDTIKMVNKNIVQNTIERQSLISVQTPQRFYIKTLLKAYKHPSTNEITDEAMLIEEAGMPIHTVLGDIQNIKLTYPKDISILEALLKTPNT